MFGDIIKRLRIAHNFSQVQLAKELTVSKQTVSNWENNNILPSIDMLIKISKFFSVSKLKLSLPTFSRLSGISQTQTFNAKMLRVLHPQYLFLCRFLF